MRQLASGVEVPSPAQGECQSGSVFVLVDYAAEDVTAADRRTMAWRCARLGHGQVEAAVRTGAVVVAYVLAEHRLRALTAGDDEEMVQAVLADSAHPALGEGVRD